MLRTLSFWHDVFTWSPLLFASVTADRRVAASATAFLSKIAGAVIIALSTGAAGGALGAYVTLTLMDFRIKLLEDHRIEDRQLFRELRESDEAGKDRMFRLERESALMKQIHETEQVRNTARLDKLEAVTGLKK
jgi:hypothetical protein